MKMLKAFMGVLLLFTSTNKACANEFYNFTSKNAKVVDLPPTSSSRNLVCLALNVYHESRGASLKDQEAVANVTINRSLKLKKNICDVVYSTGQFSWVGTTVEHKKLNKKAWKKSLKVAWMALMSEERFDPTHGATYFYEKRLHPKWSRYAWNTHIIGDHIFCNIN